MTTDAIFGPGFGGLSERERLVRTARELEAVVVAQVFSSMRKTVPESDLFEKSAADDIFRSMLDDELARVVSEKSPFGLAQVLEKELGQRLSSTEGAGVAEPMPGPPALDPHPSPALDVRPAPALHQRPAPAPEPHSPPTPAPRASRSRWRA